MFGVGRPALRQSVCMADRMLTEREAFRAARCFIQQFNEREKSDSLDLWVGWMEESTVSGDPEVTADPAQWHDWLMRRSGPIRSASRYRRVAPIADSGGAESPAGNGPQAARWIVMGERVRLGRGAS